MRNNIAVSKNFLLSEFECPCCGLAKIDSRVVNALQKLRDKIGVITVTSGCRCKKHNAEVGGVADSAHLYGRAVDIAVPAGQQTRIKKQALESGFEKVLCYPDREYIHMQINK